MQRTKKNVSLKGNKMKKKKKLTVVGNGDK